MILLDSLRSLSAYPVPPYVVQDIGIRRGVDLTSTATAETLRDNAYCLAKADVLMWLALAPNVSQGGQSYSFSDAQRVDMRNKALAIYKELGESTAESKTTYGYKGSRL